MDRREVANRVGVLVACGLLLGALAAVLWSWLTVLPTFVVEADGHATIGERGMANVASADWWFAVLGLVGGLVLGVAVWWFLRPIGWPVALVSAGVALLAGGACWLIGEALGPGPFAPRMAAATAGQSVPVALQLHAVTALALWPFAAVAVPLFAASLGPELADPEVTGSRRRRVRPEPEEPLGAVAPAPPDEAP